MAFAGVQMNGITEIWNTDTPQRSDNSGGVMESYLIASAKLLVSLPWEKTAIDCIATGCERIQTEVFRTKEIVNTKQDHRKLAQKIK